MEEHINMESALAVLISQMEDVKKTVDSIEKKLESNYVTNDRFEPVRNIAYGFVALVLTTVVLSILALVVRSPK